MKTWDGQTNEGMGEGDFYGGINTRNWYEVHTPRWGFVGNQTGVVVPYIVPWASRMSHIPKRESFFNKTEQGPLEYGMCYDLHCDDFFDKDGLFNFDAWHAENDKEWFTFTCESFTFTSKHKCGYRMFGKILEEGIEHWLTGKEPEITDAREGRFVSSLASIQTGPMRLK